MSFLGEIKRRKVFRVAVAYVIAAWLIAQVVDVINEPLNLPGWFDTAVLVSLGLGSPIAVILAWIFDVTPEGVVRTPSNDKATDAKTAAAGPDKGLQIAEKITPNPEVLRNSVAVLPLENLSPNPDDAYFAAGIHEEILNYVAKIKDINVIARTSVKRYQHTDKPIGEIAAELRVGTIMEGSVRYAGDRVRVTAQLIDAATESHLWSEVYERDIADVFAIQADIAEKIAAALAAELSAAEKVNLEKTPTNSPEAYAFYLRAMTIIQEFGQAGGSVLEIRITARSYLDAAITADLDFALAYVQRGHLLASLLNQDPGLLENYESRRAELETLALKDLEKALALDPDIGSAHAALARIHQFNWRAAEARAEFKRALELAPNDSVVLMDYAVFCTVTDDHQAALEFAHRSISLNPNSAPAFMWLAMIHQRSGDLPAAIEAERRAVMLSPTFGLAHLVLSHLERFQGDHTEALKQARLAEEFLRDDMNPIYLGELVLAYSRIGHYDDATRIFERIQESAKTRHVPATAWILAYVGVDDAQQVLYWLTQAAENPEPYVGHFSLMNAKSNIYFYPVLDEPAHKAARDRIGFMN